MKSLDNVAVQRHLRLAGVNKLSKLLKYAWK